MFRGGYWKPAKDVETFKREVDRLWERLKTRATEQGAWSPPVDLAETAQAFIVRMELPGVEAKDIDIALSGQALCIRGERPRALEEGETTHFAETDYGRFSRRVELPSEVNAASVKAEYHNGLLKIMLPKTEAARQKEVKISVG
jgi:HSP20 family protein